MRRWGYAILPPADIPTRCAHRRSPVAIPHTARCRSGSRRSGLLCDVAHRGHLPQRPAGGGRAHQQPHLRAAALAHGSGRSGAAVPPRRVGVDRSGCHHRLRGHLDSHARVGEPALVRRLHPDRPGQLCLSARLRSAPAAHRHRALGAGPRDPGVSLRPAHQPRRAACTQ